jgi:hypothetical protein
MENVAISCITSDENCIVVTETGRLSMTNVLSTGGHGHTRFIHLNGGHVNMEKSTIMGYSLTTKLNGGVIEAKGGSLHVDLCSFSGNYAKFGAVFDLHNMDHTITNSNFKVNTAFTESAIVLHYTTGVITGNNFVHNVSPGVAVLAINDCQITVSHNVFQENHGTTYGGAIGVWWNQAVVKMEGNSFIDNRAPEGKGPDLYCEANPEEPGSIKLDITPPIPEDRIWDETEVCAIHQH